MKLIRIDLTKHNKEKLNQIEKEFNIIEGGLVTLKNSDIADVWINDNIEKPYEFSSSGIIAYNYKKNRSKIIYGLDEYLLKCEEYKPVKRQKKFNVDKIFDKISEFGMDSLTNEEKNYLIEYSKKIK